MQIEYFFLFVLLFNLPAAFAEELLITLTDSEIILDGKWTNSHEWKKSSETIIEQDNMPQFVLRYAHNYESIFLLIDVVSDTTKGNLTDKSLVCFQNGRTENNFSNPIYCFNITFDGKLETTTTSSEKSDLKFKKIENFENSLAFSGISDQYDRYSKIPHITYEYQIPIDFIGRSDIYNFYASVYDSDTNQTISWPKTSVEPNFLISNSETWGQMISPDKTIPEFTSPFFILLVLVGTLLVIQIKVFSLDFRTKI